MTLTSFPGNWHDKQSMRLRHKDWVYFKFSSNMHVFQEFLMIMFFLLAHPSKAASKPYFQASANNALAVGIWRMPGPTLYSKTTIHHQRSQRHVENCNDKEERERHSFDFSTSFQPPRVDWLVFNSITIHFSFQWKNVDLYMVFFIDGNQMACLSLAKK